MESIKTIIVDDESRIRRALERQVLSCGDEWEVVGSFSDGLEAYEAINQVKLKFDLLITDVRMPEMDGLTLVKKLNESYDYFPMIVSGYDEFSYLQTAMREGSVDYILKPVDRTQFRIQLSEVKEKIIVKRDKEQKWEEVQEKAVLLQKTQQTQLLSEVTWSAEIDQPQIDWNRHFPSGLYRLIYIGIDQFIPGSRRMEINDWEICNQTIQEVISKLNREQLEGQGVHAWWWRAGKFNYWLLLYTEHENNIVSEAMIHQFINDVKIEIHRLTPITVSIGVGIQLHDLSEIQKVRDELRILIQRRIVTGGNHVFYMNKQSDRTKEELEKGLHFTTFKNVQQIISTMENVEDGETIRALQMLFRELEMAESPYMIENAIHLLAIRIIDHWMDFDGFTEESKLLSEALQITRYAGNFQQLKDGVKNWVLKVKKGIAKLKERDSSPISQAKEWINQNLGEAITIKQIADHVFMSPTYFSNLFKAQTGETVLDYVTKCRLKKAKELLEMSDLKVYDISKMLGYQDTKYFSKLFKQWQGKSPSQYRMVHGKYNSE
ncbi:response regulator transcription factor [Bacillus sp. PS06]|uniref:response regulator transcription factor n=1 Tax=Bacillus sp. PS06 TaxID=2764176 RepID=UPI00177C3F27|nr:helix-turn-helix domain-containing protein [Bacillus sp. PS06]MBD8068672.1 AraC family transcriptional regulator [Bacillus sp. PS06]